MKLNKIFITLFAGLSFVSLQAQELSKSEKKVLKKEIKNLLKNPVKYKFMKDNLEVKETIIKEQLSEITKAETEKKLLVKDLSEARDSIGFYENKVTVLKPSENCKDDSGMRYRVQIGLYEQFDITSFLEEVKVTSFEKIDGKFRYSVGNFKTEDEAELFKEAIRKMGIRGAFVSYYLDGERIPK